MIRAFIAVELNEACRAALSRAVERLKRLSLPVRWVRPANLHVTLKFLGDTAETDVTRLCEVVRRAAAPVEPFELRVEGIGAFPPGGRPRVVFADLIDPAGGLESLFRALEEGLACEFGLKQDHRPFAAHVTIGRVRKGRLDVGPDEMASRLRSVAFGLVRVDSVVLMSSDLRPEGPVYGVMYRAPLGGA